MHNPTTVDAYIAGFPEEIAEGLEQIRGAIHQAAPEAKEAIKYGIPTFVLNGNLVHFAAFKKHFGLYPTPSGTSAFKEEIAPYKGTKGSIHFPLNKPLPLDLITQIVTFRIQENAEQAIKRKKVK
ncbi:iron chaperone [Tellurirhabdus bombi]|uniref:iron chaperone n=1 Tax=Tellurirhabdus bombi TaxID=2907205 RepID=UPI001F33D558|nr:DUF1801 domain-containing protein [Tellurirhabdus bombi]